MRRNLSRTTILTAAVAATLTSAAFADTLFLTGRATTIRTSTDGGVNWSVFTTVTGGQLRGIDTAVIGGNTFVLANNLNGGSGDTDRPLLAFNSAGTQVASTNYNRSGAFNEQPVGYFGGYAYVSAGGPNQLVSSSFNGSSFGSVPMVNAELSSWQGNNITFASNLGTNYFYITGTSGTSLRRAVLNGDGTVSSVTGVSTSGGPSSLMDLAFTASGRLLTIGSTGIFLSSPGQYTSNSISLSSAFSFSGTENPATGDMGAIARDFSIIGNNLYAVTDTNVYRCTIDDTAGTISFVSANTHGFNNTGVQIAGIVPLVANGLFTWDDGASGSWGNSSNRKDTNAVNGVPNGVGHSATIDKAFAVTVTLDGTSPTIKTLNLSGGSHTIAQGTGGTLTLSGSGALISATSGVQTISAPVSFANNVAISTAIAAPLTISGAVGGAGPITINAFGERPAVNPANDAPVTLENASGYTGTVNLARGMLILGSDLGSGASIVASGSGSWKQVYLKNAATLSATVSGNVNRLGGANTSGSVTFSGAVSTTNDNIDLSNAPGGTVNFAGDISGNFSVTVARWVPGTTGPNFNDPTGPTGTVRLSGNNSFNGAHWTDPNVAVVIEDGTLIAASNTALGSATSLGVASGNRYSASDGSSTPSLLIDGPYSVNHKLLVRSVDNIPFTVTATAGGIGAANCTFAGDVLVDQNLRVTADTGGKATFSGVVSGSAGLTKVGNGVVALTNTNTYAGATNVNAGKLLVNGANTGLGAVAVNSGGTLGGTGSIAGGVTVNAGGTLAPGASAGTLSVASVTLDPAANTEIEIESVSSFDQLVVTGSASINGSASLQLGAFEPAHTDTFTVVTAGSRSGTFSNTNAWGLIPAGAGKAMLPEYTATSVILKEFTKVGDVDFSGIINNQDIAPFVAALTGPAILPPSSLGFAADINGDGVNLYDASVHNQSDQVFFDSQSMWLARWPNPPADLDLSRPVKAVTNAFISKTRASNWTTGVVVDDDIAAVPDASVVGAEVYFQPNNTSAWSWAFTGHVTAKSGGQLTFKSRSDSGKDFAATPYDAASRYFVFNKRELLDAPGEWFHDKSEGKLYLWAPGGVNPEGRVSAKKREFAFNLDSRSYITIEGIRLFACSITTDLAAGVDNISGAGNYTVSGVYPDHGHNLVIDHNVIWNVEWGIHIQNQSGDAGNMLIYNNTIRVKRFSGTVGYGPFGVVKNAPGANHAGTVVRNNIISSSDNAPGYTAIDFATDNTINRIVSDNLLWNNVVGSPTDPKFTDAAAGDFTLQPGSAAIDVGASIPAYTRDGIVVPAFPDPLTGAADVGAHEFGQAAWSAGASSMPRVRGTSWNDANGNGTRDAGEGVLAGRTIYLDRNDNGNLDMTEDRSTSATGLPKAIADNATTTSSLAVSGFTNAVARVTVSVYLTHTRMSDIILTLVHPDGTRVTLLNRRGGNGDNLGSSTTDVVFDDSAGTAITSGSPPWTSPTSTWRPESPLSALAGKSANGDWTLEVRDAASSQTGTLRRWSLRVVTEGEPSTVTDADGAYAFEFNTPQTVSVRQVLPADWYATVPAGAHVAEVTFGQETIRDFGSRQFARGDLNGDGVVNNQDIAPFVLALTNVSDFATQYPSVPLLATGDVNGDGVVNNQDIAPFVALLTGGRTADDAAPTSVSRMPVRRAPSSVPAPSLDRVVNLVLRPEEI